MEWTQAGCPDTARLTMGTVQCTFHQVTLAVIPTAFNERGLGSWLVYLL